MEHPAEKKSQARRLLLGLALVSGMVGAVCGYFYGIGVDRTISVEKLLLPDLLSRQYPGVVEHISPITDADDPTYVFTRTITKDAYIKWLESSLRSVQIEEQKRAITYANKRVADMFDNIREGRHEIGHPMTEAEKRAALERMYLMYAQSMVIGWAHALADRYNQVSVPAQLGGNRER